MVTYTKSKKFIRKRHNHGLVVLSALVVFVLACLVIFYLFQTNNLISCSYQIREQKKLLKTLEEENRELESQIAQWRSPANLENLVQSLGMVEIEGVVYLKTEKAVAIGK